MHQRYQNLTKDQFKQHVSEAYKKAIEYDTSNPN